MIHGMNSSTGNLPAWQFYGCEKRKRTSSPCACSLQDVERGHLLANAKYHRISSNRRVARRLCATSTEIFRGLGDTLRQSPATTRGLVTGSSMASNSWDSRERDVRMLHGFRRTATGVTIGPSPAFQVACREERRNARIPSAVPRDLPRVGQDSWSACGLTRSFLRISSLSFSITDCLSVSLRMRCTTFLGPSAPHDAPCSK